MNRPDRIEEPTPATERDLFERIGYSRCEVEQAERVLSQLQGKHQEMTRQIQVVEAENACIERELLRKLDTWKGRDEALQRVEDVLPQLKAVTGSLTYRAVHALLRSVNRVRRVFSRTAAR